ncbi:MAG: site-2 protease family protein [Caldilineaceae bacterium]|nr:site-2 protease family protein [Caldilineaceae bacterium]
MTLFKVFDIDVRVHWSFVLILAWGAFAFSSGTATPVIGALYGILVIVLLFVCVTLHEFGHALVARAVGIRVEHITLLPIGGLANLERMPERPSHEFFIAIAGPLVNFLIALLLIPLLSLTGLWETILASGTLTPIIDDMRVPSVSNLLLFLFATNITLGLFNLLPAFPMDGGRILRALLALAIPYVRATQITVLIGRMMAILFALYGIYSTNIMLLLIAFFVYLVGGSERESVESKAVLGTIKANEALTPNAVSLYTSERIDRAVDLIMNSYQTDYPVKDLGGQFVGVLTRARLIYALKEIGPEARIVDVMIREDEVPTCAPTQALSEVWEMMVGGGGRVVAVKNGREFLGLLTIDDITEVFQVYQAKIAGDEGRGGPTPSSLSSPTAQPEKLNG